MLGISAFNRGFVQRQHQPGAIWFPLLDRGLAFILIEVVEKTNIQKNGDHFYMEEDSALPLHRGKNKYAVNNLNDMHILNFDRCRKLSDQSSLPSPS